MPLLPRHPVSAFRAFPSASVSVLRPRDITAPQMAFATGAGTTLNMEFGKQLHADYVPATTDVAVTVDGSAATVSAVSLSGSTMVLTMGSSILQYQIVKVSYTKPAANRRLQDLEHQEVGSFSGSAVINTVANSYFTLDVSRLDGDDDYLV